MVSVSNKLAAFALGALLAAAPFAAHAQANKPTDDDGSAATHGPIVVLITLDGFPARALKDPRLPMPELRKLEANGAHADAMIPINPTVTWPNHTTLITGVNASVHHVMQNGLITFPADGAEPQVKPWVPKNELVHAETLYDAAAAKGLTTGQVDWVAIYDAKHVKWQFAERPQLSSPIVQDLIAQGTLSADEVRTFDDSSPAWRDEIWTDAAIDILVHHTPNLLLFHLLQTDTLSHEYGTMTNAAFAAYAYADTRIAALVRAARQAGLLNRITFVIASDHGFANYSNLIRPNAALVQLGLLKKADGQYRGKVWCVPVDGVAYIYIRDKSERATLVPELKAYFEKVPGIEGAYTNKEAQALGLPATGTTDQAPDLLLAAKPNYSFEGGFNLPLVHAIHPMRGNHGYLNSYPDMQALFVASGAHIRPGVDLGTITNLRVAPTIAKLLGVSLPAAKQKPLTKALW